MPCGRNDDKRVGSAWLRRELNDLAPLLEFPVDVASRIVTILSRRQVSAPKRHTFKRTQELLVKKCHIRNVADQTYRMLRKRHLPPSELRLRAHSESSQTHCMKSNDKEKKAPKAAKTKNVSPETIHALKLIETSKFEVQVSKESIKEARLKHKQAKHALKEAKKNYRTLTKSKEEKKEDAIKPSKKKSTKKQAIKSAA